MSDTNEFIKQLCCVITEKWVGFSENDEDFENEFRTKYPLINYDDMNWKKNYFDLADSLYEIGHPQAKEISNLLYSSINGSFKSNFEKLKIVFEFLKSNTIDIINYKDIEIKNDKIIS